MKWQFEDPATRGRFFFKVGESSLKGQTVLNGKKEYFSTIVYNPGQAQLVVIDGITYTMPGQSVLPLVQAHEFSFARPEMLVAWQFNPEFYYLSDKESELTCMTCLVYNACHPLFVHLGDKDVGQIVLIQKQCVEDMLLPDELQGEMLRSLLRQLIIRLTRLSREQRNKCLGLIDESLRVIREFNLLVEANFRRQHQVKFYASEMGKSPKTLTNLFALWNHPPPSSLIYKRIILEAKKYQLHTNKLVKEVSDELGFSCAAHFSRFFKINTGVNFSDCRQMRRGRF